MTLNDLKWPFKIFTITSSPYLIIKLFLQYILTVESVYTRDQRTAEADRDPQNIGISGKTVIFRRHYIVGTLTNKTNISI